MKRMLLVIALLLTPLALFAQDVVVAVQAMPWESPEFLAAIVPIVTPMLIWVIDKIPWAKIPTWTYPMLAALLGYGATWLDTLVGVNAPWYIGLALGLAGIGVRELVNQIRKRLGALATKTVSAGV